MLGLLGDFGFFINDSSFDRLVVGIQVGFLIILPSRFLLLVFFILLLAGIFLVLIFDLGQLLPLADAIQVHQDTVTIEHSVHLRLPINEDIQVQLLDLNIGSLPEFRIDLDDAFKETPTLKLFLDELLVRDVLFIDQLALVVFPVETKPPLFRSSLLLSVLLTTLALGEHPVGNVLLPFGIEGKLLVFLAARF